MKYIAIIGDIIDSKNIENRYEVQNDLDNILNEINEKFKSDIAANFLITIGDEFQGLLKNGENVFEIIDLIQLKIYPIEIRFGVGIGSIKTKIDPNQAIKSDGPVWWNARYMIDELRKKHERGTKFLTNIKLNGIENNYVEDLINQSIMLATSIKNSWTNNQLITNKYIIEKYGFVNDFLQIDIAKNFHVDSSSINRRLKKSQFYDYIDTLNIVAKLINNELRG